MSRLRQFLCRMIEQLGLDWFVLLIGKPAFQEGSYPYPTKFQEVRDKFSNLMDIEKINDATEYCTSLLEREEKRSYQVESKAFTLIGITGIATGFIIGFASLLLHQDKISSSYVLIPAAILYILVVISLMWTIFLSVKVVTVGEYKYTYPNPNDIFDLLNKDLHHVKRERAASLFFSFVQNHKVVDRKATFLNGSQVWFRNSIILLFLLTLLIAVYTPIKPYMPANGVFSSTITSSQSLGQPKITLTITPSSSSPTLTKVLIKYTTSPVHAQTTNPSLVITETINPHKGSIQLPPNEEQIFLIFQGPLVD